MNYFLKKIYTGFAGTFVAASLLATSAAMPAFAGEITADATIATNPSEESSATNDTTAIIASSDSDSTSEVIVEKASDETTPVAEIEGVGQYTTLTAAIKACADGQTIKLISNAEFDKMITISDGRHITIDMNGHNIDGSSYFEIIHGGITFDGEGTYTSSDHRCISLVGSHEDQGPDYSVCTVNEDVTVISTDTCTGDQVHGYIVMQSPYGTGVPNVAFMWGLYGVAINFHGTGIGNSGIYINGDCQATEGSVTQVDLTGATLMPYSEDLETEYNGIYAAGYGEWTLEDVDIVSATSITMKSGIMTINSGIFACIGTDLIYMQDDSDSSDNHGATISLASNEDYAHYNELKINGGDFEAGSMCFLYENIPYKAGTTDPAAPESYVKITINDGIFKCAEGEDMFELLTIKDQHIVNGGFYSTDKGLTEYLKDGRKVIDLRTAKYPEQVIADNTSMEDLDTEEMLSDYPYAVVPSDYTFETID